MIALKRGIRWLVTALMACLAWACSSRNQQKYGVLVEVPPLHVHDRTCGHYRYNGGWYYLEGHEHGPECGHTADDNGIWLRKDP